MYGRNYELQILNKSIHSNKAELGIVYGRRRIGKSTLLKSAMREGDLYFEAIQGLPLKDQIRHFITQLARQTHSMPVFADSWSDAFEAITPYMRQGSRYVVFDELPWMASERSKIVSYLKYYWDQSWKDNPNLTLVLCGSIAQFMVKHVVHSSALHNRKTFEIKLEPLHSYETELFFKKKRSRTEMTQFLMVFGGVPKYLEQIDPNCSLSVNLDDLAFKKSGFFVKEFETIFKEQFKTTKIYSEIVKSLSKGSKSKEELSREIDFKSGGGLTSYLENLEQADFIRKQSAIDILTKADKPKTAKYVLWDEWLRFYFRYISPNQKLIAKQSDPGLFRQLTAPSIASFFGLHFESFCIKNISCIFKALRLEPSEIINFGPFFKQGVRGAISSQAKHHPKTKGIQIDILLQRRGNVLTLIECKFQDEPIGYGIIEEVERKVAILNPTSKVSVERVLISASGVTADLEEADYFNQILGLEIFYD